VPGHNRLILLLHPALVGCCCPQAVQLSLQGRLLSQQPAGHPASKPSELSAGASSFGAQLFAFVQAFKLSLQGSLLSQQPVFVWGANQFSKCRC
jgi:hypothetical protein